MNNDITPFITDKKCLITGGGGSIGGEIARALASNGARKIILADIYENGAYDIWREIGEKCAVEIVSVRDADKMDYLFSREKPEIVFHAAAHKHVPLMEQNPEEAVKNNIRGTEITAKAAAKYGVKAFALISTDKAVEPSSVMGASKRVCEMLLGEIASAAPDTTFFTVRFGNVMGSNGSVIPLFKKQIQTGEVTVTDKNASRYFMTAQDAAYLTLLSLTIAQSGNIFVFDMGESVNILQLAEKIIRESGKEPYTDVKIRFTGLRKGDKLHEKLFYDFETPERTKYDKIMRIKSAGAPDIMPSVNELYAMAADCDRAGIRRLLSEITGAAL